MPPKRKAAQDGEANSSSASAPVKKQRVSRACDQCRSAREKCDGTQPRCMSCLSLDRDCTYNVPPKKRGVQTGLIRTLESALVWVFEQFPGAEQSLNNLLAQDAGREFLQIGKESETGNRLHRRWRKSKTHKEIDRLLSGKEETSSRQEPSEGEESGAEPEQASLPPQPSTNSPRYDDSSKSTSRSFQLPAGYARLLDIYFAYTHCWLPILDKERILAVASGHRGRDIRDPELWSALAVASFQDPGNQSTLASEDILASAWSLLPLIGVGGPRGFDNAELSGETTLNAPQEGSGIQALGLQKLQGANAYLLLCLVMLGRDEVMTSSLLIGLAVRTVLPGRGQTNTGSGSATRCQPQASRTLMACFLLDTVISTRLGQAPHQTVQSLADVDPLPEEGTEEWDPWAPLNGFGTQKSEEAASGQPSQPIQSLSSFNQLIQFARVLNQKLSSQVAPQSRELAQALDSRFSFCNSILGGAIPFLPPAYLLQLFFLCATLTLTPDARVSLLWTMMEAIENALDHLGPGVSPLLITFMSIAKGRTQGLGAEDRDRWNELSKRLKSVWHAPRGKSWPTPPNSGASFQHFPLNAKTNNGPSIQPPPIHEGQNLYYQSMSRPETYLAPSAGIMGAATTTSPSTSRSIPFTPSNQTSGFPESFMSPLVHLPPDFLLPGQPDQMIDHDAILEELASFECADTMETDPQFMTNLGFAPGSDFTDMRGEFGAL